MSQRNSARRDFRCFSTIKKLASRSQDMSHEARIGLAATHFTYQVSLPPDAEIDVLAASLLAGNIAETAIFPGLQEIRLANRYNKAHEARSEAQSIQQVGEITSLRGFVRWAMRNPGLTTRIAASLLRSRILGSIRAGDSDLKGPAPDMKETLDLIDSSVADRHLLVGALAVVDRELSRRHPPLKGDVFKIYLAAIDAHLKKHGASEGWRCVRKRDIRLPRRLGPYRCKW
jgi:hypothetical protein